MNAALVIVGNTNMASFVNCISAATEMLRRDLVGQVERFRKVHVVHTSESFMKFASPESQARVLSSTGLHPSDFVHHVVDLAESPDRRLDELVSEVARIAKADPSDALYFDLTGGVTQVKVALAILAFLLGVQNVYTLEVDIKRPDQRDWDLDRLRGENVSVSYRQISSLEKFDQFGLSNLTAVQRVGPELGKLKSELIGSFPDASSELDHLVSLLKQAEALRLEQEDRSRQGKAVEHADLAATRSILFHATAAAEALVDLVVEQGSSVSNGRGQTFGQKLRRLRELADGPASHPIDSATFGHLTDLLLRLRNRAAHWSTPTSDLSAMRLQGELGLRLAKSFIWLIVTSLQMFIGKADELVSIRSGDVSHGEWYVGIDGDKTGEYIGAALIDATDAARDISIRSGAISQAIREMEKIVKKKYGKDSVLFACGDNILFRGEVSLEFVKSLLALYSRRTRLSASAGVGRTPYQASLALSLAKGEGGGAVKVVTLAD